MNNRQMIMSIGLAVQAALLLFLSHYQLGLAAAAVVAVPWIFFWWRSGWDRQFVYERLPELLVGLSAVTLISLTGTGGRRVLSAGSQILVATLYAAWVVAVRWLDLNRRRTLAVAGVTQAAGVTAVFLIATFWHWPDSAIIVLMWLVSAAVAFCYLGMKGDRAAMILAATWGLVSAQIAWVLTIWLINYNLGDDFSVPQATIVLTGLGYCVAGIYESHQSKRLSQRRLIEFLVIAGILLAIVVAGTRWLDQNLYSSLPLHLT